MLKNVKKYFISKETIRTYVILKVVVNCMKKLLLLITLSFICINVSALELNISSDNVVMYNMKDNKVLYEKNSNEKVQIASLTKIMTAIVTLDTIKDLNNRITLTSDDFKNIIKENLVSAGFKRGQTVTYLDLLDRKSVV